MLLATLAAPSRAADAEKDAWVPGSIEDLRRDVSHPEDFRRFVEGSSPKHGDVDGPRVFARRYAASAALDLPRPQSDLTPERVRIPPLPNANMRPSQAGNAGTGDFPLSGFAVVLGIGILGTGVLIGVGRLAFPIESEPTGAVRGAAASSSLSSDPVGAQNS